MTYTTSKVIYLMLLKKFIYYDFKLLIVLVHVLCIWKEKRVKFMFVLSDKNSFISAEIWERVDGSSSLE